MAKFDIGDKVRDSEMQDYLEIVDIDEVTNALPKYKLHDDWGDFWSYCFGWEKECNVNDALRYGEVLTDDMFSDGIGWHYRIRTISYDNRIFYHKMVNGEVVEFKELTV